jgi:hypothetical protein
MRLDEFYNAEYDKFTSRQIDDTRKPMLSLQQLNKLRKIREIKKAEDIEHDKFVKVMYAAAQ